MRDNTDIVINTGPILALVAALGSLDILASLYRHVVVPKEVANEILAGGPDALGVIEYRGASFLSKQDRKIHINPYLANILDLGEASVIQTALNENIATVCIDESSGRRIARLHGLNVTGSIGVILRAKSLGFCSEMDIATLIKRMRSYGVWISPQTELAALKLDVTTNYTD